MPFPGTNGWDVLAIIGRRCGLAPHWPQSWTSSFRIVHLLVLGSWLSALAVFLIST